LKHAVELDPNFALAYAKLGVVHYNTFRLDLAAQYAMKAFELRENTSEREKLSISTFYFFFATEQYDKAVEPLELWKQTYPRDFIPHSNLSFAYITVGQWEKAMEEARETIRLNPNVAAAHMNLALALEEMGRFDEAKAILQEAVAKKIDAPLMHQNLYLIAFIQGDQASMKEQLDWAAGKPFEDLILYRAADTLASSGQLRKSHEMFRRAISIEERRDAKEGAALSTAEYGFTVAMFGDCQQARKEMATALRFARAEEVLWQSGVALALCGDTSQAQAIADELVKKSPKATIVNSSRVPVIRAAVEIARGNPAKATQLLQVATPYFGTESILRYVRGLAYLRQRAGAEAAAEFQKIIADRTNEENAIYSLSYLGLARAAALAGDASKSRKSYEDFFSLWKNADPDIPVLIEAKKEYQNLR
jgi:tetratricopeptide (TPR) repeat protein